MQCILPVMHCIFVSRLDRYRKKVKHIQDVTKKIKIRKGIKKVKKKFDHLVWT